MFQSRVDVLNCMLLQVNSCTYILLVHFNFPLRRYFCKVTQLKTTDLLGCVIFMYLKKLCLVLCNQLCGIPFEKFLPNNAVLYHFTINVPRVLLGYFAILKQEPIWLDNSTWLFSSVWGVTGQLPCDAMCWRCYRCGAFATNSLIGCSAALHTQQYEQLHPPFISLSSHFLSRLSG